MSARNGNNPGRKCSICSHINSAKINALITGGKLSFRNISQQYGMNVASVSRHASDHLKLDIRAAIQEQRVRNSVNAFHELREQLEFAKGLREKAKDYIEAQPKDYKGAIKTGLDAVKTCDVVIDKFAKIEGLYQSDRLNDVDRKRALESAIYKQSAVYVAQKLAAQLKACNTLEDFQAVQVGAQSITEELFDAHLESLRGLTDEELKERGALFRDGDAAALQS